MDAPPESEDGETISWIVEHLNLPRGLRNVVRRVLRNVRKCTKDGTQYTGRIDASPRNQLMSIPLNSVAAAIIAESMEDGAGIRRAHSNAMDWLRRRKESGEDNMQY